MGISNFEELKSQAACRSTGHKRLAVVWGSDDVTRAAVSRCLDSGCIDAVFVGCRAEVEGDSALAAHASRVTVVDADDPDAAAVKAVELVHKGEADIVMKGHINTDNLLRAVLNKEYGILRTGEVLTHVTVAEIPAYHKLLLLTDVAVIPYPTPAQRDSQMRYVLSVARSLGIEEPKVVMTHCSEKVDGRHFPFTLDYVDIKARAQAGDYGSCIVDGPLDVKTAMCPEALVEKGIDSPVGGDADILIFPDIEAGNTFYKTITLFAGARIAGMLCGTMVPVVLPSRGDTPESKSLSIMLASLYS